MSCTSLGAGEHSCASECIKTPDFQTAWRQSCTPDSRGALRVTGYSAAKVKSHARHAVNISRTERSLVLVTQTHLALFTAKNIQICPDGTENKLLKFLDKQKHLITTYLNPAAIYFYCGKNIIYIYSAFPCLSQTAFLLFMNFRTSVHPLTYVSIFQDGSKILKSPEEASLKYNGNLTAKCTIMNKIINLNVFK